MWMASTCLQGSLIGIPYPIRDIAEKERTSYTYFSGYFRKPVHSSALDHLCSKNSHLSSILGQRKRFSEVILLSKNKSVIIEYSEYPFKGYRFKGNKFNMDHTVWSILYSPYNMSHMIWNI